MTMGDSMGCVHCGLRTGHDGVCPRVKSIEYYQDGMVRRVELWRVDEWAASLVDAREIAKAAARGVGDVLKKAFDDAGPKP